MGFLERVILISIIVAAIAGYLYFNGNLDLDFLDSEMTSRECADKGGEIVNSLSGECDGKKFGDISDLVCPCVCCEK
jgi:hypothetical protein